MKTSSYDEPYDEDEETNEVNPDEYCCSEAPVDENYTSQNYDYESSMEGYESSFAKCTVAPVARSCEAPVAQSYEAPIDQSYEDPVALDYEASFAKCVVTQPAKSHETPDSESLGVSFAMCPIVPFELNTTPVIENYETPITENNEKPVVIVTPQSVILPNEPPPVPKRTLLPCKTPKETSVQSEAQKPEAPGITEVSAQNVAYRDIELVSPEDNTQKTEAGAERWSDSTSVSLPGQVEDVETVSSDPGNAQCEPVSEMYYTASSEVSLLSDTELPDKVQNEDEEQRKDDRKNVIAGHVAAMRERFESMTRTNTPCPDLIRSLSPSLEVFRTTSPSPDRLA